ncbi:hypothetical protein D9M73_215500 [compost metagenome]
MAIFRSVAETRLRYHSSMISGRFSSDSCSRRSMSALSNGSGGSVWSARTIREPGGSDISAASSAWANSRSWRRTVSRYTESSRARW